MRKRQHTKFSLELCSFLILWPSVYADDFRSIQQSTHEQTSQKANQLYYGSSTESVLVRIPKNEEQKDPSNFSKQEEYQYKNLLPATSFPKRSISPSEPAIPVSKHEHQSVSTNFQTNSPVTNVRRQQSEVHHHKRKYIPGASYVMKAGGKEKFYGVEESSKDYPQPEPEFFPLVNNWEYDLNKETNNEKLYKRHKYAYSPNRGEAGLYTKDHEVHGDGAYVSSVKSRVFNSPNYPKYMHPSPRAPTDNKIPTMEFHAAKGTSWKQLGPNVEISTSAEHPVYSKRESLPDTPKNSNKKRKILPKNIRSGYLNQQHALYISNNLGNFANLPLRPVKGIFDHNNVMKQSDKFELSDAMFQEIEEAKKNSEAQIRIKQESPKEQYYKHQPDVPHGYHHHYQDNFALLNAMPIESSAYVGKYYQPHSVNSFGKGFIRNVEIESGPSGGKRMVPALIIPLTPDQLNNQVFNHEIGLYVNNPEVLNPSTRVRQGQPSPFETMNSRYSQNDQYSPVVTAENYQYQQIPSPYEFRVTEDYNPYVNYQAQNVYRLPYNLNSVSSTLTPVTTNEKSPDTRSVLYSAKKKSNHKLSPSSSPLQHQQQKQQNQQQHPQPQQPQTFHVNRVSPIHPTDNSKINYKREEYVFDANNNENYLSASESFTTVASIKDKDQKMVEKIETKQT